MKLKPIITGLLLLFVGGSVAYMVFKEIGNHSEPPVETENPTAGRQVVVYYFHGDMRCMTCAKLEGYAQEVLDTQFADQLTSGLLVWKPVNTDKSENEHFVTDYQLVTKSIILSDVKEGQQNRWENLDKIWELVKDKQEYMDYIQKNINRFLEEGSS